MCGENYSAPTYQAALTGSSPRVRGKLARWVQVEPFSGLIPACAGKTCTSLQWAELRRAHPRVCGENRYGRVRPTRKAGSSPRVRGKLYRENAERATYGLIPACAGKTVRDKAARLNCWAHPRVCGENMPCGNTRILEGGSSPRVRGKPHSGSEHNTRRGLIPACAGKTRSDLSSYSIVWAHPRVCGENLQVSLDSFRGQGSSPRVRGKLASGRSTKTVTRLIPACAGKT